MMTAANHTEKRTRQSATPALWMDRPIFRLNQAGDQLTLRDLVAGGVSILGSSGSGKTSGSYLQLLAALLAKPAGLSEEQRVGAIVYFFKSGDVEDVLRIAEKLGRLDDVIHVTPESQHVYNLLENEARGEDLSNIVEALIETGNMSNGTQQARGDQKFWINGERALMTRTLWLLKLAGIELTPDQMHRVITSIPTSYQLSLMESASSKAEGEPLTDEEQSASKFIRESACCQYLMQAAERVGDQHPGFLEVDNFFLNRMANSDPKVRANFIEGVAGQIDQFLVSELLSRLFCGGTTVSPELAMQGKIILLDLPIDTGGNLHRRAQLLYKYSAMRCALRRNWQTHPNPVVFAMDECVNYIMKEDSDFLNVSRSKGVVNIYCSQSISNYYYAFGGGPEAEARTHSIMSNLSNKFFHANNDHRSNVFASDTIGKDLTVMKSFSAQGTGADKASASGRYEYQYVVQPLEFQFLATGGANYDFLVEAIFTSWRRFADSGTNFLRTCFNQRFLDGQ